MAQKRIASKGTLHTGFIGVLVAPKGHLLFGGRRIHLSYPFSTEQQAQSWVDAVQEGNIQTHRKVAKTAIRKVRTLYEPIREAA